MLKATGPHFTTHFYHLLRTFHVACLPTEHHGYLACYQVQCWICGFQMCTRLPSAVYLTVVEVPTKHLENGSQKRRNTFCCCCFVFVFCLTLLLLLVVVVFLFVCLFLCFLFCFVFWFFETWFLCKALAVLEPTL